MPFGDAGMEHLFDPAALETLRTVSVTAFAVVFGAGLLMGVAPSSFALYPVVAGHVAGGGTRSGGRGFALSGAFVLGMATVDAALGALFGLIGGVVIEAVARYLLLWNLLAAALLAGLGLALLRVVRLRWPVLETKLRRVESVPGAYALGVPFGLTTCPACTPMVLPMLAAAAVTGTWSFGAGLMFVFGLGRGVPLLLVGAGVGVVARIRGLGRQVRSLEAAAGVLLLLAAAFFFVQAARLAILDWS